MSEWSFVPSLTLAATLCALASAFAAVGQPAIPPAAPPSDDSPLDAWLAFDTPEKSATIKASEVTAQFVFRVTNVSQTAVTIDEVTASCGCTVAKLPAQPWTLAPGARGEIPVTMNVAGKTGEVVKAVYVTSHKRGTKMLLVKTTILPPPVLAPLSLADRTAAEKIAHADRQAVLRGECAACHVDPARGLAGRPLYLAACAICHDAEHRATMVPDLHALPHPVDLEFWRRWITHGRADSLMPAFAQAEGGFLTEPQIVSLVAYLNVAMRPPPPAPGAHTAAPSTASSSSTGSTTGAGDRTR